MQQAFVSIYLHVYLLNHEDEFADRPVNGYQFSNASLLILFLDVLQQIERAALVLRLLVPRLERCVNIIVIVNNHSMLILQRLCFLSDCVY